MYLDDLVVTAHVNVDPLLIDFVRCRMRVRAGSLFCYKVDLSRAFEHTSLPTDSRADDLPWLSPSFLGYAFGCRPRTVAVSTVYPPNCPTCTTSYAVGVLSPVRDARVDSDMEEEVS